MSEEHVIDGRVIPIPEDMIKEIDEELEKGDIYKLKDICNELLEFCTDCSIGANLFPPPLKCKCTIQSYIDKIYAVI